MARTSNARTQTQRSTQTRLRLVQAATASLIESGYAYTTTVEVCQRAGLTRGAFHHHYASLGELLVSVLEHLYDQMRPPTDADQPESPESPESLEALLHLGAQHISRPEFKAVIEIWLAARNDSELAVELRPAIAKLSLLFSPNRNSRLSALLESDPSRAAFYRLMFEALIGLALGRATSTDDRPVEHEKQVIDLLASQAREYDRR
ncbi:MAG: AcrR family transcriptional regulator [Hyphomicrobiaceae bacterium]|jgi:AcrR family transcriptional regulator